MKNNVKTTKTCAIAADYPQAFHYTMLALNLFLLHLFLHLLSGI
ncbi:hypothetical protein QA601_17645 [Chitinispirillales bacterium ANBcel5]|nr:hypothetical protein [Chitinispirillales bacterium ANBcel5]